jgi:hypothetical protein
MRASVGVVSAVVLLLGLGGLAHAQRVSFRVEVQPRTGTTDDTYLVTFETEIEGVSGVDQFFPPDWGEFLVLDSRSQSSQQMSIGPGGQSIKSVDQRAYLLRPKRAGKLKIGEARVRVDGQAYATKPQVITVTGQGAPADPLAGAPPVDPGAQATPGTPRLAPDPRQVSSTFLHAVPDRQKARVGDQINVTWYLYTRSEVLRFMPAPPRFDGFWTESLFEPQNYLSYQQETVGNREYSVAVVARRALFPTRAGKLVVPPFRAEVATIASGNAKAMASPPVELEIEALPPGAPAGMDPGMIGQFQVNAALDRTEVPAGETLELTLTVSGQGAIRRTRTPELKLADFEVYQPRDYQESLDITDDVVRGQRTYRYMLTPRKGGVQTLGPVELAYFNTQTGRYDVARTEALEVKVVGDPSKATASKDNLITRDIRPLMDEHDAAAPPLHAQQPLVWWLLQLLWLPPIALGAVTIVGAVRSRMQRDTPRLRLRRARDASRQHTRAARAHLNGGRVDHFYRELAALLSERVAARLGQPIGGFTRAELRARLASSGLAPGLVSEVLSELDACDAGRYAPGAGTGESMRAALERIGAIAQRLDEAALPEEVAA